MEHEKGGFGKIALVAGAALGALFLFSGSSSASSGGGVPVKKDPCQPFIDQTNILLPTATKADVPALKALRDSAQTLGCADLAGRIQAKIDELSKSGVVIPTTPAKPTTLIFDPALAEDPATAHSLALQIGKTKVPDGAPSSIAVASDGTYATFEGFCADAGRAGTIGLIISLHAAAAISIDGKCGAQTTRAWNYYLTHSTRPDGSSDARNVRISGETSCDDCGASVKIGSCCSACASGNGGCNDEVNPLVVEDISAGWGVGIGGGNGPLPFGGPRNHRSAWLDEAESFPAPVIG